MKRKKVLDILRNIYFRDFAKQKGAEDVLAIDVDEWAVENSQENADRNEAVLRIEQGTAETVKRNLHVI